MQVSLALVAASAAFFFGNSAAYGPPPGCKQTADSNAGYCLCSTPVTSSVPATSTVTTTYSTVYTLRGPKCFPPSYPGNPGDSSPPEGCHQTADSNAGYCLCTTASTTEFATTTYSPITTETTTTLRGPKCFPPS